MRKERIIIGILLIILVCETMFFTSKLESMQRIIANQDATIQIIKNAYDEKFNESIP